MPGRNGKTLLFIDDEDSILDVYCHYFEMMGYEVLAASNGFDASELVRSFKIDAIVTDLRMPNVDGELGIEVMNTIKPEIPIIVRSAFSNDSGVKTGLNGVVEILDKTVSLETVHKAVENALGAARQ